jgi:hypothetical protein
MNRNTSKLRNSYVVVQRKRIRVYTSEGVRRGTIDYYGNRDDVAQYYALKGVPVTVLEIVNGGLSEY